MNTIANHGTYVAPRLVDATIDKAGERHESAASATHAVLKPETAAAMVPILEQVWCVGTAESAPRIEGYSVAGKTGTGYIAQNANYMVVGADGKLREDGYKDAHGQRHYNASFAGFLPAENPKITILVTIIDPPGDTATGHAPLRRQRRGAGVQRHRPRGAAAAADPPVGQRWRLPASAERLGLMSRGGVLLDELLADAPEVRVRQRVGPSSVIGGRRVPRLPVGARRRPVLLPARRARRRPRLRAGRRSRPAPPRCWSSTGSTSAWPRCVVDDARVAMAPVAAAFHGHPSRAMTVVGVTGTTGKTTTTHLLAVDHGPRRACRAASSAP